MIYPIIIAGGSGSRLWPLSRELYPKQFLTLTNNSSMLQQTFSRLSRLSHYPPMVICNEEHRFITAEQIRTGGFSHSGIILEPFARNTAPAIALAAMQSLVETDDDPLLLILAADHLVEDVEAFSRSIESAIDYALEGQLVTFGIIPQSPETGYGYIKRGQKELGNNGGFKVEKFVEKPDSVTAQAYLDTGDYYWNSGMFMFKASSYLEELKKFSPDIYFSCRKSLDESNKDSDLDFVRLDKDEFKKCPSDSIDYAVMEKTSKATVVSMNAGWSDIGSWSALWDISDKDDCNNVSKGDVITHKSTGNYLHSEGRLIATVCVDDLIVVDTKDAILVASRHHVQDVKGIVNKLTKYKKIKILNLFNILFSNKYPANNNPKTLRYHA